MAENSPLHDRFVKRFLERLAEIDEGEKEASTQQIADRLNAISGGGWDKSKVLRLKNFETQKYSLDDYEALAFLVGSSVDELTHETIRGRELQVFEQRAAFSSFQDAAQTLVNDYDELMRVRANLIATSKRLRSKYDDSTAPFDLDVWEAPLTESVESATGTSIHAFFEHIRTAITATTERLKSVNAGHTSRFDREKKAEKTLSNLLGD